jgi:hypothetical protein
VFPAAFRCVTTRIFVLVENKFIGLAGGLNIAFVDSGVDDAIDGFSDELLVIGS